MKLALVAMVLGTGTACCFPLPPCGDADCCSGPGSLSVGRPGFDVLRSAGDSSESTGSTADTGPEPPTEPYVLEVVMIETATQRDFTFTTPVRRIAGDRLYLIEELSIPAPTRCGDVRVSLELTLLEARTGEHVYGPVTLPSEWWRGHDEVIVELMELEVQLIWYDWMS